MQIFAKTLDNKTVTINVEPTDTGIIVKKKIEEKSNIPSKDQRLVFIGKEIEDDKLLTDYNVQNASTLNLIMRLPGGNKILVK